MNHHIFERLIELPVRSQGSTSNRVNLQKRYPERAFDNPSPLIVRIGSALILCLNSYPRLKKGLTFPVGRRSYHCFPAALGRPSSMLSPKARAALLLPTPALLGYEPASEKSALVVRRRRSREAPLRSLASRSAMPGPPTARTGANGALSLHHLESGNDDAELSVIVVVLQQFAAFHVEVPAV